MGTGTMSDIPIRNVQRETFNSQLSTGRPKGRMAGGIWGQTRSFGDRTLDSLNLPKCREDGRGWLQDPDMGTDTVLGHRGCK